ncbi:MAG: hypothetical protein JNL72_02540 [Flavipsychrobacter sp.]|nr:hypothetical protein [Flavipsychrobacter sp.]
MTRENLHGADGSMLGYLVQVERAIFWLCSLPENAVVGIEVEDDISTRLNDGENIKQIYEQAKNTINSNAPYSDKSEDLWKTLAIWVNAVLEHRIDIDNARFSIFSNRPIPTSRLIYKISQASEMYREQLSQCVSRVKEIAGTLRTNLKSYGEAVINCPDDTLQKIISRVEILDANFTHDAANFTAQIKSLLHLSDDLPVNYIIDILFGNVSRQLIECWQNRRECWVAVSDFNREFTEIISVYKKKSFLEKTIDLLPPINSTEIDKNKSKKYVEQLKLIDCDETEILEGIYDYIRATGEKSRFAKDGELSEERFAEFYSDLKNNWAIQSRPRFKFANEENFNKIGYELYYKALEYKGILNRYVPEQHYTYKGAYHHLANELEIGWHPHWETKLKDGDEV